MQDSMARSESCGGYEEKRMWVVMLKKRSSGSVGIVDILPVLTGEGGTTSTSTEEGTMQDYQDLTGTFCSHLVFNALVLTPTPRLIFPVRSAPPGTACRYTIQGSALV